MPGPTVNVTDSAPNDPTTTLTDYASGTNPVYIGRARSNRQQNIPLTITSISKAATAVVTSTAHGLQTDNRVTISGATGDWAAINGVQIITRTGANTFTIAFNTSAYTGTFDGSITTTAPQTSAGIWAIQKLYYSGDSIVRQAWAAGSSAATQVWDNITSLSYE